MSQSSSHQIGELLVLVLGEDATLRSWLRTGIIERETALYERMFARGCYDRMVVVSRGTDDSPAPFERFCELISSARSDAIHLVSPIQGEDPSIFSFEVASRVLAVAGNVRLETGTPDLFPVNPAGSPIELLIDVTLNGNEVEDLDNITNGGPGRTLRFSFTVL